jgi:pimeloyl-ACP methyl ester carboxylesterase
MGSAPEETLAAVRARSPQLYETVVGTPEIMTPIAERIPGALFGELPGTPHMQTLERPELVAQALDRFPPTSMPDRIEHR